MERKAQDKALRVALQAAKGAGLIALKHFRRVKNINLKEGAGLVSEADLQSEKFIMKTVRKNFPEDQFLGEEGGLSKFEGHDCALWVVDPLDGTTNYVHGFPFFCVSIGLEIKKELQVAVVHAPLLKYTFTAIKDRGAYLNGKKIKVSKTEFIKDSLLATGFSYRTDALDLELRDFKSLAGAARGIRRAGSAALDMCMVAWGVFDGFWERDLSPWDTAAGTLIIREAGGVVTNFSGERYHSSMKSVLAGNPKVHPLILKNVRPQT